MLGWAWIRRDGLPAPPPLRPTGIMDDGSTREELLSNTYIYKKALSSLRKFCEREPGFMNPPTKTNTKGGPHQYRGELELLLDDNEWENNWVMRRSEAVNLQVWGGDDWSANCLRGACFLWHC